MSDPERKPKQYTPEEKVAILRRHLVDKEAVSSLCEQCGVHPTLFYRWLKQFFENGAAAFGPGPRADKQVEARDQRIAFLEAKLTKKDEVLAELVEEHVAFEKSFGEI
jgi:transposase-like protein